MVSWYPVPTGIWQITIQAKPSTRDLALLEMFAWLFPTFCKTSEYEDAV